MFGPYRAKLRLMLSLKSSVYTFKIIKEWKTRQQVFSTCIALFPPSILHLKTIRIRLACLQLLRTQENPTKDHYMNRSSYRRTTFIGNHAELIFQLANHESPLRTPYRERLSSPEVYGHGEYSRRKLLQKPPGATVPPWTSP